MKIKQSKNAKSPLLDLKKPKEHVSANCYSITIRTGHGIPLGSNSVDAIIQWFTSDKSVASILVREQIGLDKKTEHFQGGVFYESPIRQDKLREKLLPLVMAMYQEQVPVFNSKDYENVKKHALKVVAHNSFPVLFSYCTKQVDTDYNKIEFEKYGPWSPHELAPQVYCKHNYPYWKHLYNGDPDDLCKFGPCSPTSQFVLSFE